MAMTFAPAVCGGSEFRFWGHVLLFWTGAALGAVITGATAYAVVHLLLLVAPKTVAVGAAISLAGLCIARDAGLPLWVPYRKEQVPEWLRRMLPSELTAVIYGWMIGLGFATRYTYSGHFAMVVGAAFLSFPALVGVAVLFAASKTLVIVLAPRVGLSEIGEACDRRFLYRRYGTHALRGANATLSALVLALLLFST